MSRRKVYPVPEIVFDDSIKIESVDAGNGSMDNEARIMRVPLIDTPACRHVRAHEMAHAKYSPKKPICPAGVHPMIVQRVEDMRMNTLCRVQGLHTAMDAPIIEDRSMWARLLTGQRENLTAGISVYDTGDWKDFLRQGVVTLEDVDFIGTVSEGLKANPIWHETQRQAIRVARYLRGEDPDPDPSPAEDDENSSDEAGESETTDSEASEGSENSEDESSDSTDGDSEDSEDTDGSDGSGDGDDSDDTSDDSTDGDGKGETDGENPSDPSESMIADGSPIDLTGDQMDKLVDQMLDREARKAEMSAFEHGLEILEDAKRAYGHRDAIILPARVTELRMPQRLAPSKFKSRAKVPADRGMVPKHMNRYCTDKAIFAGRGRKRSQGGTILIDCSGSMTINSSQIDTVMNIAPLGTIASYSGSFDNSIGGDIWVIAKNGKRAVKDLRPPGVMNRIDVPALEWMVKQDGPYFWVCDGAVSGGAPAGSGERFGANIFDKCIEIVERHGIVMVPMLSKLPEVMEEVLGRK